MRLRSLLSLKKYDIPTCVILSLMCAIVIFLEIIIKAYHDNTRVELYVVIFGMFSCCFYTQGLLAGIVTARAITLDMEEEEKMLITDV